MTTCEFRIPKKNGRWKWGEPPSYDNSTDVVDEFSEDR